MDACEGYACPPTHSVPVDQVIQTTHDVVLASTGVGMGEVIVAGIIGAAMVALGLYLEFRR